MTLLTENGLAIGIIGGLATTLALVFFLARRTGSSLGVLAAVAALTIALLAVEQVIQTDREQVAAAVHGIYGAIDQNDLDGVLAFIDPGAVQILADAQAVMPLYKVENAGSGRNIEITLNETASPMTATSSSRAFVNGTHSQVGHVPYVNQRVDLEWVKSGDGWLLTGYTAYHDGKPINVRASVNANRPVP